MPHPWQRSGEREKSCASSANLFAFTCGPPWAWIDWSAVLTELDIEHGLARIGCEYGCNLGHGSHDRDRLPRKHKLSDIYRNALHPGDEHMIPAPGIEDQELSIAAERTSVNTPAVTRRCNLCAGPRCQRNAFFYAAGAVGTAEIADFGAVNRESEQALGGGKSDRRRGAVWVLEKRRIGPAALACSGGPFRRGLHVLLHFRDQALQAVGLFGERDCARALSLHVLFDRALLALPLIDQGGKPRLIRLEPVAIG